MPHTVIVHIENADPFVADVDELPDPKDQFFTCTNPRLRDGKPLHYVTEEALSFIFPWHRISFIEIMPAEGEREEVEAFFRE
ncbi:MAG: hypothetical protein NUW24_14465 [Anaerolineae bacterium]|nr:hypothetical protein [Anaerolineae bacterium]MDH7475364.1 hypothetical protein [Anaerolineae bacterium]